MAAGRWEVGLDPNRDQIIAKETGWTHLEDDNGNPLQLVCIPENHPTRKDPEPSSPKPGGGLIGENLWQGQW